jgi:hypothetical protein
MRSSDDVTRYLPEQSEAVRQSWSELVARLAGLGSTVSEARLLNHLSEVTAAVVQLAR